MNIFLMGGGGGGGDLTLGLLALNSLIVIIHSLRLNQCESLFSIQNTKNKTLFQFLGRKAQ